MCIDCGCQQANKVAFEEIRREKENLKFRKIEVKTSILDKNNKIAETNRQWFLDHKLLVFNLMSAPGSGKTLLLEKTSTRLKDSINLGILVGDQERDFDAKRLEAAGAKVKQLNTASSCHLDAAMIRGELGEFVKPEFSHLIIENVGNLVCPASFDLGESRKVAILSTTEGEDKPSKYPLLFHEADLIVITKIDLVQYLEFSFATCVQHIRGVNAAAPILCLSAKTGQGLDAWLDYVRLGSVAN